jgi:hypothetical protein
MERWTGSALTSVAGKRAADEIVFGAPGDLVLLGSRTLEGLNFRVEPVTKRLVVAADACRCGQFAYVSADKTTASHGGR